MFCCCLSSFFQILMGLNNLLFISILVYLCDNQLYFSYICSKYLYKCIQEAPSIRLLRLVGTQTPDPGSITNITFLSRQTCLLPTTYICFPSLSLPGKGLKTKMKTGLRQDKESNNQVRWQLVCYVVSEHRNFFRNQGKYLSAHKFSIPNPKFRWPSRHWTEFSIVIL